MPEADLPADSELEESMKIPSLCSGKAACDKPFKGFNSAEETLFGCYEPLYI